MTPARYYLAFEFDNVC